MPEEIIAYFKLEDDTEHCLTYNGTATKTDILDDIYCVYGCNAIELTLEYYYLECETVERVEMEV